jgi:hypothetical protein
MRSIGPVIQIYEYFLKKRKLVDSMGFSLCCYGWQRHIFRKLVSYYQVRIKPPCMDLVVDPLHCGAVTIASSQPSQKIKFLIFTSSHGFPKIVTLTSDSF